MAKHIYTNEFKQEVVRDIESGKYKSADEVRRIFKIGGSMTVYKWLAKYGKSSNFVDLEKISTVIEGRIMENSKEEKIKELEKELTELRISKRKSDMELEFYKIVVDIAKEDFNIDLKKKYGQKQQKG